MTNVILPVSSSHWYYGSGKPCYELPNASKPGQKRRPTVVDARKLGLVPSVTSILGIVSKPGLEAWKAGQYILSALTLPRRPGESADAFSQRVVRDAQIESNVAADFGTNVHALVELWLNGQLPEILSPLDHQFLNGFMEWAQKHEISPMSTEQSFACYEEGFGGRTDFLGHIDGRFVLADWKTQKTKPGEPLKKYPEWPVQLAAYRRGLEEPNAELYTVVVSSTEPGRVEGFLYEPADWHWRNFQSARNLWFSPMGPGASLKREDLMVDLEFKFHEGSEEFYMPFMEDEEKAE